jgi:hypothetical protein
LGPSQLPLVVACGSAPRRYRLTDPLLNFSRHQGRQNDVASSAGRQRAMMLNLQSSAKLRAIIRKGYRAPIAREPLDAAARHDLLPILEERYDRRSTIVPAKLPSTNGTT